MPKEKTTKRPTFYRDFFGALCLLFLAAGFIFSSPYAFWLSLFSGVFSRTAERKGWRDPVYADSVRKLVRSLFRKPLEDR